MSKKRLCDLELHLHHETEKALLLSTDGDSNKAEWIPKSVCEYEIKDDGSGDISVTMSEQYAIDKGLV